MDTTPHHAPHHASHHASPRQPGHDEQPGQPVLDDAQPGTHKPARPATAASDARDEAPTAGSTSEDALAGHSRQLPPNPAWDYIQDVPRESCYYSDQPVPSMFEFTKDGGAVAHRDHVVSTWTWAIPDPQTLDWITAFVNDDPHLDGIVDWGAGNGYWAAQLAGRGLRVVAYDASTVGSEKSWYGGTNPDRPHAGSSHEWYPVLQATEGVLTSPDNRSRALFLCWPPYATPAAKQALLSFSGEVLIYIGEREGGCTGDDDFFDLLNREWDHVGSGPLTSWWAIHDSLEVYRRR